MSTHGKDPRRITHALVLLGVSLALVAGCSGGDTSGPQPAAASATPAATPTAAPTPPATPDPTPAGTPAAPSAAAAVDDQPVVIPVAVAGGQVINRPDTVQVKLGEPVRVIVMSDVAEELHVHGYDLFQDVVPGEAATLEFVADIPGQFEAELEDAQLTLFTFEVR